MRVAPCSVLVVRGGRPGKAPEIRRILCAVDLSEHSRRALEVAAQLAHGLGASLEALHAWAVPFHVDAGASRDGLLDRMRDNAHAELDAFIARASLPSGVELSTSVVSGPPTAAITEHVASSHPDLLVIHARRRSLLATRTRLNRENFPKLGLIAGVDAAPVSPIFGILGVTGELPVARRNQGPRAVVARMLETEEARLALKKRRIFRDIRRAWDAHARRVSEYSLLSDSALPAAKRSFDS